MKNNVVKTRIMVIGIRLVYNERASSKRLPLQCSHRQGVCVVLCNRKITYFIEMFAVIRKKVSEYSADIVF